MALHSLEFKPAGPDTDRLRVDLHTRRARSFDALGLWMLEVHELEARASSSGSQQIERRCECVPGARASLVSPARCPSSGTARDRGATAC